MYSLRKIEKSDINQIVDIHMDAFPDFFLTSLGKSFLKCYYRTLVNHPKGIGACVAEQDTIHGFAVGTVNAAGFHKNLIISNPFTFFLEFVKLIFTRPYSIIRILNNLEKNKDDNTVNNLAELLSIGVKSVSSGKGIGKMLLKGFEEEVKKTPAEFISLTTDYYDNEGVFNFYLNNNYEVSSEFETYPNRKMYKLIKKI